MQKRLNPKEIQTEIKNHLSITQITDKITRHQVDRFKNQLILRNQQ